MKEALAERLLAKVMGWDGENVAGERPLLEAMANLKYDEYQQFSPGIRFIESLALWLNQFKTKEEMVIAYNFVKNRMIFFSDAEIAHLISIAYPDHIRPLLIKHAADYLKIPEIFISKIINNSKFKILKRQCLFLGLSDGSRIDAFRRSNTHYLSHEQIWQTYDISLEKSISMKDKLNKDLSHLLGDESTDNESIFRMIFLLDDFSGSGLSYLRWNSEKKEFEGKISKFYHQIRNEKSGLFKLIDPLSLSIYIILYIASIKSIDSLEKQLMHLSEKSGIKFHLKVIQRLEDSVPLNESTTDKQFFELAQSYYDREMEDEHTQKGGKDVKLGFAGCALPVILSHNTPNNSVALLWADPDRFKIRGLFPRVSRHRSEP